MKKAWLTDVMVQSYFRLSANRWHQKSTKVVVTGTREVATLDRFARLPSGPLSPWIQNVSRQKQCRLVSAFSFENNVPAISLTFVKIPQEFRKRGIWFQGQKNQMVLFSTEHRSKCEPQKHGRCFLDARPTFCVSLLQAEWYNLRTSTWVWTGRPVLCTWLQSLGWWRWCCSSVSSWNSANIWKPEEVTLHEASQNMSWWRNRTVETNFWGRCLEKICVYFPLGPFAAVHNSYFFICSENPFCIHEWWTKVTTFLNSAVSCLNWLRDLSTSFCVKSK